MWLAARAYFFTPVSIAAGHFVITCLSLARLLLTAAAARAQPPRALPDPALAEASRAQDAFKKAEQLRGGR